jgi:hypothetical protein
VDILLVNINVIILMTIQLMVIDGYGIVSHWWFFYWWLLVAILLIFIDGYCVISYWLLLYVILQ